MGYTWDIYKDISGRHAGFVDNVWGRDRDLPIHGEDCSKGVLADSGDRHMARRALASAPGLNADA